MPSPILFRSLSSRVRVVRWLVLIGLVAACGDSGRNSPLYVSPSEYDFSENPALLDRILASSHGYFRFINRAFLQTVCDRFAESIVHMPIVNLHGDAHMEQYAVADSARGLTDFDDSTTGPGIIDLARFGVSVSLAAKLNGWGDQTDGFLEEFFRGLRDGTREPERRAPEPRVVADIRERFDDDRMSLLAGIDALMDTAAVDSAGFMTAVELYRDAMYEDHPGLPPHFFTLKRAGRLRLGVGSALDEKYLLRVEGPTEAEDDDLVLEAKEVRDLSGVQCIQRRASDVFKILTGQSRIAYQPYRYLGYIFLNPRRADEVQGDDFWDGTTFWVHAWADNYEEISIGSSFATPAEFREVVYDVGVQLGRGHAKDIAYPHESQLRRAMAEWLDDHEVEIKEAVAELTVEVVRAWDQFRNDAAPG